MSNRRLIATNTIIQLLGKLISTLSAFLVTYLLGRHLGVEFYGHFTKVIATSTLMFMVLDFGFNAVCIRIYKHQPHSLSDSFRSLLGLRLSLGALIYLIILFSLFVLPTSTTDGYTLAVKLNIALYSLQYFAQAVTLSSHFLFQSRLEYTKAVIATNLGNLAQLGLIAAVITTNPSLSTITVIHLTGIIITSLTALIFIRPLVSSLLPTFSLATFKPLIISSFPLGLALTLNLFATRLDTIFLTLFRSNLEVGYYGLSRRIFEGLLVIPAFFMNAVYPVLIEKSISSRHRLPHLIKETSVLLFVGGSILALVAFLAAPLITLIRPEFTPGIISLRILALSLPVFFLTSLLMWSIITLGKTQILTRTYAIALLANALLNLLVIPRFGFTAAAVTTGLTELLVLVLLIPPVIQSLRESPHRPH